MAEKGRMTAVELVDKLMGSEHADVVRESVAWLVAEVMEAEVGDAGFPPRASGRGSRRRGSALRPPAERAARASSRRSGSVSPRGRR